MAVGTGFGQLFRGVGQVGGVAISSAVFQSMLETELKKRITGPGSEAVSAQVFLFTPLAYIHLFSFPWRSVPKL